jgi:hypothetical protein
MHLQIREHVTCQEGPRRKVIVRPMGPTALSKQNHHENIVKINIEGLHLDAANGRDLELRLRRPPWPEAV